MIYGTAGNKRRGTKCRIDSGGITVTEKTPETDRENQILLLPDFQGVSRGLRSLPDW